MDFPSEAPLPLPGSHLKTAPRAPAETHTHKKTHLATGESVQPLRSAAVVVSVCGFRGSGRR